MGQCKLYHGDIFLTTAPIICHQVNCLGYMGAGLALQIKQKYPSVFEVYNGLCQSFNDTPEKLLGETFIVDVTEKPGLCVANVFAQLGVRQGPNDQQVYTDYNALKSALVRLEWLSRGYLTQTIAMPYMMGCGLAGGDWTEVRKVIKEVFEHSPVDLELWKLN